ncbi:MAG TPA: hypothetical protein VNF75_09235 [Candidatus Dormibacteraeota bacterium]|nr:hypothetical protein [Candidatus Dormibacteraeota bacterium]
MDSSTVEPEQVTAWLRESDSEAAMELRFEIFMDELEVHASPAFGDGKFPEINRAAKTLQEALEAAFADGESD